MRKKITGLMLAVTVVITVFAVAVNVSAGGENMALIFSDDFNDNYLDPENWRTYAGPEGTRVEEINQRLEIDIKHVSGEYGQGGVVTLRYFTGEGIFEVDLQNGFSYNYLYKWMILWDEEGEYDVRLVLLDSGAIVMYMKTPEHPSWVITTLYSGDTRYWNWLFHLKLIRNSDGTFTGIVTDEYGHHFEGTTSLTVPLDVPLRVNLSAWKWKYGYPVMIFYDNFKAFGTPEEAIQYLVTTIESWILPKGTKEPLTHKLEDAVRLLSKDNLNGAIHKLNDFIKNVEAFRDKKLTDEQADSLIASAQSIIDAIG